MKRAFAALSFTAAAACGGDEGMPVAQLPEIDTTNPLLAEWNTPYGTPPFDSIRTEHYLPAFETAIACSRAEVEAIAQNPAKPTFRNTIVALERQGALLDRVSGLFFNLLEADGTEQMQRIALDVQPALTELNNDISLNAELFERVRQVYEHPGRGLTKEDRRLLEETYRDFARGGAALEPEEKELYRRYTSELDSLTLQFGQNTLAATNAFTLHITDPAQVAELPASLRESLAAEASSRGLKGWVVTLQAPSYMPFMNYSSDRTLKERLWRAYNARALGGEHDNTVVQGMQHKYRQTVMILSTNQCAMYCRHCFRKRLVGLSSAEVAAHLPEMAAYVSAHPEIDNVLISGGDAFLNSNEVIGEYLETFTSIPHIRFIRFGTRTPVTFPQRILEDDGELTNLLARYGERKQIIVVTHFNHPRELTDQSRQAVRELQRAGCVVRNQTVLLRGVNDDPEVLAALLNALVSIGVMPYYVFQCRPVEGVKNQFQVPLARGVAIVDEAKASMSGIAKAFRYAMSHPTGKIEILGPAGEGKLAFKYHQAKDPADNARLFIRDVAPDQCWLD